MRYGDIPNFHTGVAVPVFSLKTSASIGIGEFTDLVPFARWVRDCGMNLIQILPVNDTGEESSPYSARSAFALNPAYLHIEDIEGAEGIEAMLRSAKRELGDGRVRYLDVVRTKRRLLRTLFDRRAPLLAEDQELAKWVRDNTWVKSYSVYCLLKERHQEKSWKDWETNQNPTASRIESMYTKEQSETLFHSWIQWEAEKQFRRVIAELDAMGIRLKGDIPILINEDSADVWAERKYFDLDHRAGAPPDMFSYSGQNWGFPCYRWDVLEKADFDWWRRRLDQASKFYHAYRIDHVLGFFRIWMVPGTEVTGLRGHFWPALPISRQRLLSEGFPEGTLEYLCEPNFARPFLGERIGHGELDRVLSTWFDRIGGDRYKLKPKYRNEKAILWSDERQNVKDGLLKVLWDAAMYHTEDGKDFWPSWYWYQSTPFLTLPDHEQRKLRTIFEENEQAQDAVWRENGRKLLQVMAEETDMLVCAEDLGVIPDCVPGVLQELDILGLRIERWAREWKKPGQPYIEPTNYLRLSVATSSCHDSSTLAGLWEEEGFDRKHYWALTGKDTTCPSTLTPDAAEAVLDRILGANSLLAIPPLQDWLSLVPGYTPAHPEEDRVNIPGSVGGSNWTWRMPVTIAELGRDTVLASRIRELVQKRANRPLWETGS